MCTAKLAWALRRKTRGSSAQNSGCFYQSHSRMAEQGRLSLQMLPENVKRIQNLGQIWPSFCHKRTNSTSRGNGKCGMSITRVGLHHVVRSGMPSFCRHTLYFQPRLCAADSVCEEPRKTHHFSFTGFSTRVGSPCKKVIQTHAVHYGRNPAVWDGINPNKHK